MSAVSTMPSTSPVPIRPSSHARTPSARHFSPPNLSRSVSSYHGMSWTETFDNFASRSPLDSALHMDQGMGMSPMSCSPGFYGIAEHIPKLERDFCTNFTCCGLALADMHALINHFEEHHITDENGQPISVHPRKHLRLSPTEGASSPTSSTGPTTPPPAAASFEFADADAAAGPGAVAVADQYQPQPFDQQQHPHPHPQQIAHPHAGAGINIPSLPDISAQPLAHQHHELPGVHQYQLPGAIAQKAPQYASYAPTPANVHANANAHASVPAPAPAYPYAYGYAHPQAAPSPPQSAFEMTSVIRRRPSPAFSTSSFATASTATMINTSGIRRSSYSELSQALTPTSALSRNGSISSSSPRSAGSMSMSGASAGSGSDEDDVMMDFDPLDDESYSPVPSAPGSVMGGSGRASPEDMERPVCLPPALFSGPLPSPSTLAQRQGYFPDAVQMESEREGAFRHADGMPVVPAKPSKKSSTGRPKAGTFVLGKESKSTKETVPKRQRDKAFKCPRAGCTKQYLNPNGLKYHLSKGTCTIDPAVAINVQSPSPSVAPSDLPPVSPSADPSAIASDVPEY